MVDDTLVDLSEKQLAVNHFSITRKTTLSSLVDEVHDNARVDSVIRKYGESPPIFYIAYCQNSLGIYYFILL